MDTANKAVTLFLEMSATGLLVKQDELNKAVADSAKEIARQFQIISVLAGRSINVGSTQQLAEYLHEDMGYKVIKLSKKTGKPALGKKELQLLAVKTKNPIIPLIIKLKKLRKSSSMLKFTSL
jgi:DNA polymerase I-like protein with 3'-5' exonuclease and polymerase domains